MPTRLHEAWPKSNMAGETTLEDWLTWCFSPSISAILVSLFIGLSLPILIHCYLYRKASSKEPPAFLLAGPSGGGKTSLLSLFANGTASTTHTSQEPHAALCSLPASIRSAEDRYRSENDVSSHSAEATFQLVDTPGHGKLRHHALSAVGNPTALRGILFVIDSAALSSQAGLTEAADYLHDLLLLLQKRHTQAKTSKGPAAIPVLVAANKQDVFTSLPPALVKAKLEAELGRVRVTKSKALMDSGVGMESDVGGDEDEEGNWLGEYGSKTFAFAQMEEHEVRVAVLGGNLKGDGNDRGDAREWWNWIGENL